MNGTIDKWEALHGFWSSFGLPAYDEGTVPEGAVMPYITYNMSVDGLDAPMALSASLFYRSKRWDEISQKADEIADAIVAMMPPAIRFDSGRLYVTKGTPFAQRMPEADDSVRRIDLNITVEFFAV